MFKKSAMLTEIPEEYKFMTEELADYTFYYMMSVWKDRYSWEKLVPFMQGLCTLFALNRYLILNLLVKLQMQDPYYKHDVRHIAYLMYAMNVPFKSMAYTLRTNELTLRKWVRQQINNPPEIKRLFTEDETHEIIKLLTAWSELKGAYI